jgi:hypothetical protein
MLLLSTPLTLSAQPIDTSAAQITSSAYDIGNPQNCFDNDTNTLMRSAAVNPAFVQLRFDQAITVNEVGVLVGQVGYAWAEKDVWWLEVADNEEDLSAKSGTYELLIPVRNQVGGIFDHVKLPRNVAKHVWRFNVERQVGDDYVHIVDLQLFYDSRAEYNPFGKVDVSDGRITSDSFDIGRPTDCFDEDISTLVRSENINPFNITVTFPRAKDITRARVYLGQPGYAWAETDTWMLVGADSEDDLNTKQGSYQVIISERKGVADCWDTADINTTVSKKIYRFIVTRTIGDDYVHVPELELFNEPPLLSQSMLILIDDSVRSALATELDLYSKDLEHEGYTTIIHEYIGNDNDPDNVKSIIQSYYAAEDNLAGALLIGDIPFAQTICNWTCNPGYCDFFYMDLNGDWIQSDDGVFTELQGDSNPEIYVGRLYGSSLADTIAQEIELYRNYLSRNHFYRRGYTARTNKALFYTENFDEDCLMIVEHLKLIYQNVAQVSSNGQSVREYLYPELSKDYEYIHITAHSNPISWGNLSYTDVRQIHPTALFYNTHACSTARFTESNYIGGVTVLNEEGLFYIGSTTWGYYTPEMDAAFTSALAYGATVGEALMDLFVHRFNVSSEPSLQWKGQELVILGDPTIRVRD